MCPGRLGELLGLTPSNTSKVLRSAESKGLVLRELCCKDRRQMHYSLTTKGRELLASVSCREIEIPEILRKWLCG
jgi:DNA-binding MarR family transcriptional regulator